jgi:NAD-dependent dihydropyrimidine dehydrogenase PreA subunit
MYQLDYAIEIDTEKCIGCGDCVDICPADVLELQDGKSVPVYLEECIGCGSCAAVCEQRAISMDELWSN